MALKRKNPLLAGILAAILGPLGFFYFGWRHGVSFLVMCTPYIIIFFAVLYWFGYSYIKWVLWINMYMFAWFAYSLAARGRSIAPLGVDSRAIQAASIGASLFGILYFMPLVDGILIAASTGIGLIIKGSVVLGLLVLLIGSPICGFIGQLLFPLIFTFIPLHIFLGTWSAKDIRSEK